MSRLPSDHPLVVLLKKEVEKNFGKPIKTPSDFALASLWIEKKGGGLYISDTTFKRHFGNGRGYEHISYQILNQLAIAIGYKHFEEFCDCAVKNNLTTSELNITINGISTDEMRTGDRLYIAWLPDRQCSLRYIGDGRYEVEESANSTIRRGDTFSCSSFVKGSQLVIENLVHDGQVYARCTMAKGDGLTAVKKL